MTALLPARAPTPSGPARHTLIQRLASLAIAAVLILSACDRVSLTEAGGAENADHEDAARQSDVRDAVRAAPQASPDSAPLELVTTQEWEPLASVHERSWVEWVRSTAAGTGWWHGGDGNGSIKLPDGRVWHFFSDTYNGLVDEDFSRGSASNHLATNSIVIRERDGFLGQVWDEQIATSPPSHAPAIVPDPELYPDNFYWFPGGAVLEDGELRILAGLMQRDPIQRVDTHILTIDTDTGAVTDVVATGVTALDFNPSGLFQHEGWFYMHGQRPNVNVQDGWGMLRAPVGSLRDTETWQAWDGQGWNDDLAAHAGIQGTDGELLPTYGVYYDFRPSPQGFLALSVPLGGGLSVYVAESPEGPYHLIGTLETDNGEGEDANGGVIAAYAPRWHPHYDTNEGMVVSYATNYFVEPDIPQTDFDNAYYMPHYLTIPQELVEPARS